MKIAALGDIHITERSVGKFQDFFKQIAQEADILCLCGDLTDRGTTSEAEILVNELKYCAIPKVAVLGNHDFDNDTSFELSQILQEGNILMVHEEPFILDNTAFVGVKGFGGGYGKHMLGSFGEKMIKEFVLETINEVEQLEVLLDQTEHVAKKIVLMHYSPILETLTGESLEIYPFLGSSRFEDVIDRFEVSVVFHGHAHYGSAEGKTIKEIPVYNVALPLLKKTFGEKAYKLIEA